MATENSDFYGSSGSDAAAPSEAQDAPETSQETTDESGEQTALLDKAVLGGKECKVGDTINLKIVSIHEGEIEVEAADGSDDETKPESSMAASEGALDRLAKPPAEA